MKGKTCVITGANDGIGFWTAMGLAEKGAKLIMVCRSAARADKAKAEIIRKTGNKDIDIELADLSSQRSVRDLAARINEKYDRIDVLINNAGAYFSDLTWTEDKIEMTFALNHLSYFLLTNLLLDKMNHSAPSRIINVASVSHYSGKIYWDNLYGDRKGNFQGLKSYAQSKLANVLFTKELAKRLEGSGITVNALHPGTVRTKIGTKNANWYTKLGWWLYSFILISEQEGAETSIFLASSETVADITGKYFEKCKEKRSSELSYDGDLAKKLWEMSEKLTASGKTD